MEFNSSSPQKLQNVVIDAQRNVTVTSIAVLSEFRHYKPDVC